MSVVAYSLPQFLLSFMSPARVFLILCAACAVVGILSFWISAFLLKERVEEIEKAAVHPD
jgi:Na+/melibiose symporter-like transporter